MLMPTIFTVITRQIASLSEFQTKDGIVPAQKNFTTASGSILPSGPLVVKIDTNVLKHGAIMKPKNKYKNKNPPNNFNANSKLKLLLLFNSPITAHRLYAS